MERFTLTLFFFCMPLCASLVLYFIWANGPDAEWQFRIAASAFVVGLASFLTWVVSFSYTIRQRLTRN